MKKISFIISILILSLIFMANTCDSKEAQDMQKLNIGDKFTYQNDSCVDIARVDKDVIVYRVFTISRYYYFSTTRKDSIIYQIHSNVNKR